MLSSIPAIGVLNYDNWPEAKAFTYTPEPLRDYDVDIKIECCGICGSDIHAANGDWGRPYVPLAVGHEIVGTVVNAGPTARFAVGDRVGVGAQCDACGDCYRCNNHFENSCAKYVDTYLDNHHSGAPTQGGYASHVRVNSKFAFKIPDGLASVDVAPLLCGGVTGFRPLLTYGVKEGTKVGVNGIGGIGHMTIMFAKALGAEVTAISRTLAKKELALGLGADHYIATNEEGYEETYADSLDLIVNTGSSFTEGSINGILALLRPYGQMIYITAPPVDERLTIDPFQLLRTSIFIGGSGIGSPKDIEYMLKLAAEHKIKPMIETLDICEENVTEAWKRMEKGDVKFRFVLTGYDKYFK